MGSPFRAGPAAGEYGPHSGCGVDKGRLPHTCLCGRVQQPQPRREDHPESCGGAGNASAGHFEEPEATGPACQPRWPNPLAFAFWEVTPTAPCWSKRWVRPGPRGATDRGGQESGWGGGSGETLPSHLCAQLCLGSLKSSCCVCTGSVLNI